jgi:MYXO-CTERM domain-containing protein
MYLTNSVQGNSVKWTISLAAMGLSAGQTFYFDVATSGGGSDPGVDHLSRSTEATPGWGTASTAGPFLAYTVTPAPGAVALLGVAGLVGTRRRR